jgi:hypothetical protein
MKRVKAKHSFLCIDDDVQLASLCEAIGLNPDVRLTPEAPPATWESAIEDITRRLTGREFDGLLLDFRLDEFPSATNNVKVRYTAESLVNELRRHSVEGADKSYPIVLWSTADNLSLYFSFNPSYTGLYDGIWDKAAAGQSAYEYGNILISLADGYQKLHTAAKRGQALHVVLNCRATAVLLEMEQAFTTKIKQAPYTFNYATFIINRILRYNGVLIDLPTAAALLGIDGVTHAGTVVAKSATKQRPIVYSGVFSEASPRFWRDDLLGALNELSNGGFWLHLKAEERVSILVKKLRLRNLRPAKAIYVDYQTDFDCVCAKTLKPLSRRNGFRLHAAVLDAWIEPRYIAGTAYRQLSQAEAKRFILDVGEQERFDATFGK